MIKSALHIQAPVQYRGGYLFELYKGKGSQALMQKYLSILLADCVGKCASRTYRLAYIPIIAAVLQDQNNIQCGGVPGMGTDFPALATRLFQDYAKANNLSTGLLFVDAKEALCSLAPASCTC